MTWANEQTNLDLNTELSSLRKSGVFKQVSIILHFKHTKSRKENIKYTFIGFVK